MTKEKSVVSKGVETREVLLTEARHLFNKKGTDLTLATIAEELNVNRSMITNHFQRKRDLIYGVVHQYEEELAALRVRSQDVLGPSFAEQAAFYSEILDLVFSYRGVISYVMTTPAGESMLEEPFRRTYEQNINRIKHRIDQMIEMGLISKDILDPSSFRTFEVQYITIVSSWFISYGLYYRQKEYKKMKPHILIAIFNSYLPFLTEKGRKEIADLRQALLHPDT